MSVFDNCFCHMDYFNDLLTTFLGFEHVVVYGGSESSRTFRINLCFEDEWKQFWVWNDMKVSNQWQLSLQQRSTFSGNSVINYALSLTPPPPPPKKNLLQYSAQVTWTTVCGDFYPFWKRATWTLLVISLLCSMEDKYKFGTTWE